MFNKKTTKQVPLTLIFGLIAAITMAPLSADAETAPRNSAKVQKVSGFNWLANGNDISKREARARQAARRASLMSTRGGATWICSPAGFGQPSRCYRG